MAPLVWACSGNKNLSSKHSEIFKLVDSTILVTTLVLSILAATDVVHISPVISYSLIGLSIGIVAFYVMHTKDKGLCTKAHLLQKHAKPRNLNTAGYYSFNFDDHDRIAAASVDGGINNQQISHNDPADDPEWYLPRKNENPGIFEKMTGFFKSLFTKE